MFNVEGSGHPVAEGEGPAGQFGVMGYGLAEILQDHGVLRGIAQYEGFIGAIDFFKDGDIAGQHGQAGE